MRTSMPIRALGFVILSLSLAWLVAACASPTAPTGSVEGQVTKAGVLSVSGVVVRAQGKTTLTDANGRFTLEGIAVPYDLSLSQTSGDGWLHVLEGLTDRTPVIDPLGYAAFVGTPNTSDVSGALSAGGAWPLPAGRKVVVCVSGEDDVVIGCDTVTPGASSYALTATLLTSASSDVRVHALRIVVDVDGRPTGYEGYGSAAATLVAGVPAAVPIALDVVPPVHDLVATFDVPGGATLDGAYVFLRIGAATSLPLFEGVVGDALTLPVPVLDDARYVVLASVTAAGGDALGWSVADGFDAGTLALAVPPQLLEPAPGATGVTTATAFEVAVAAPSARTFRWRSAPGPDIALTTTRASVTLPDPAAAGFAWPAGVVYQWDVFAYDAATVDGAASTLDRQLLVFLAIFGGVDLPDVGTYATTVARDLTLAP